MILLEPVLFTGMTSRVNGVQWNDKIPNRTRKWDNIVFFFDRNEALGNCAIIVTGDYFLDQLTICEIFLL